ncbi:rust resistance kinase Lr10-like isoform X2 [Daucus carota subsp. sativus]|uniref:rust resistance kinase Lr10-like isoform X2 n=1 Tax=Daucus carota subsp. sativus TaxID=79200 RepID=UPI003082A5E1
MSSLILVIVVALTSSFCKTSSAACGDFVNISCPFYLQGQQHKCRGSSYQLSCDENNRTMIALVSDKFYVEEINYVNSSLRIIDSGLARNNYSCDSIPLHPFFNEDRYVRGSFSPIAEMNRPVTYIDCPAPVGNSSTRYIPTRPCSSSRVSSYVVVGYMNISEVENNCTIRKTTWVSSQWPNIDKTSFLEISDDMAYGVELSFKYLSCLKCHDPRSHYCRRVRRNESPYLFCTDSIWYDSWRFFLELAGLIWGGWLFVLLIFSIGFQDFTILGMALGARYFCGIAFLSVILIYKWRRRHLSAHDTIEDFLQGHNNLMPIRYTYSQIKKCTKGFNDKLGEGGFGAVYKGKLRSGLLVAVKILSNSKASDDQDFINEVGTIGRIHHVGIVRLVGFCVEGSKRALVYEFMPNGSLDKYIFQEKIGGEVGTTTLSCEKIYEISCKVACGIEYLHRGCDMQILHFDIKPNNILLDAKFNPKISDFGLAKLCATDHSIVTMTAARGTLGYMAPELFYQNIGGVSYKADVYSFGMLLLEMAGKRHNVNPFVDESSQIYFPSWIYDQISKGKEIEMDHATNNEKELIKKMIIVAMWCIQMKPTERPSMQKVIEMLEGDLEVLVIPPKPLICPQEPPFEDQELDLTSPI